VKYYATCLNKDKKEYTLFYRVTIDNEQQHIFLIHSKLRGNKRPRLNLLLYKNNRMIGYAESHPGGFIPIRNWKNITEEKFVRDLKQGNLSNMARKYLFKIFGNKYFGLTDFERRYFSTNFSSLGRLIAFYKSVQKERRYIRDYNNGKMVGNITREFEGKPIIITTTKIKKAMRELFNFEPEDGII
jgi:hypothetical protein